jgi:hypothetical protein
MAPPPRRWLQFRLRSLLFLELIAAGLLALWNFAGEPYRRQRAAIAALTKAKARFQSEAVGPAWLGTLTRGELFVDVVRVDHRFTPVDSALANELGMLQGLRELTLVNANLQDSQLAPLRRLKTLKVLNLEGNPLTDASVAQLIELKALKELGLQNTAITDDALKHVAGMRALRTLHLDGTRVTDAGIKLLPRQIEILTLNQTAVTEGMLET